MGGLNSHEKFGLKLFTYQSPNFRSSLPFKKRFPQRASHFTDRRLLSTHLNAPISVEHLLGSLQQLLLGAGLLDFLEGLVFAGEGKNKVEPKLFHLAEQMART